MRIGSLILATFWVLLSGSLGIAATTEPIVLELFTSQGCSSCPPADALVKQLSTNDPSLLPLSFHVHYWDYLGWKDPFSSVANTDRQKIYSQSVGDGQVFTPQLIVNGKISTIGSQEKEVREAIAKAKQMPPSVDVSIVPDQIAGKLTLQLSGKDQFSPNKDMDVWGISFKRYKMTSVDAGENGGRTLENINNVTSIKRLGVWQSGSKSTMQLDLPEDGFAVILQAPQQGPILGAAVYLNPS